MRSRIVFALGAGLVAIACGSTPPPPPSKPDVPSKPTATPDAGGGAGADTKAADAQAVEALTKDEAKSGNCDAEHQAALTQLLDAIEANVRGKSEDGKPLKIESFTKKTLALNDKTPKGFQLTLTGKGTQVHVLAYGVKEISLDATAAGIPATTMRSPYHGDVGASALKVPKASNPVKLEGDSRQIEMKPGQQLEVKMRGAGCAGVVVFSK
jgi:hypothetical protein